MPTENPKISAYVPQVVYDRFKQFQEERELSMSQAAIEIFAHYFGINLEVSLKEFTGGLPGRLIQVERSLTELKELYNQLASKVEHMQTTSKPPNNTTIENLDSQIAVSELPSELKTNTLLDNNEPDTRSELPSESQSNTLLDNNEADTKGEVQSSTGCEPLKEEHSDAHVQLNLIDSPGNSLGSSPKEFSLPETKLAERLSMNRSTLSHRRKKSSVEDFANMTSQADPDSIKWVYSEQLKSYVPNEDLSEEQSAKLKIWKQERSSTK